MIKFYSIIILLIGIIILQSCSGSHTISRKIRTGDYTFYMTDSIGNQLADGTMTLDTTSGNVLSGVYQITNKYVENFPGLRTMKGNYAGNYDITIHSFYINMNPKLADANVMIKGKYTSTYLAGEWVYSTNTGIMSRGNFRAEPND